MYYFPPRAVVVVVKTVASSGFAEAAFRNFRNFWNSWQDGRDATDDDVQGQEGVQEGGSGLQEAWPISGPGEVAP